MALPPPNTPSSSTPSSTLVTPIKGPTISAWSRPDAPVSFTIPPAVFLGLLAACIAFAAVLTWFVLYHQTRSEGEIALLVTRMETALRGIDGRQDTLERSQNDILREQTRLTTLIQQIPALQALLQGMQTPISANTIALRVVEDKAMAQAQALGELKKETLDLRVRINDLLYVKRVHPPPKKERPHDEP